MVDRALVGYEALLKPLKDHLLKNWSMSLAHVLEEYLCHLQRHNFSNFTQAALLLQNSATFYCKRVDVVFQIIEELIDGVSHCSGHDESTGPSIVKRRRLARALENDDLDLLDCIHTDAHRNIHVDRCLNSPPPKQIVVNKYVNEIRKPSTSIPLTLISGVGMGCKEDYRLFGETWADGTVNADFNTNQTRAESTFVVNGLCDLSPSNSVDDLLNSSGCGSPMEATEVGNTVEETPTEPAEEPPIDPLALITKQLKVKLCRAEDWNPVSFDFKFPLKILKRRRVFELPQLLIEEAKLEAEKQKKKLAKKELRQLKLLNGSVNLDQKPANLTNGDCEVHSPSGEWSGELEESFNEEMCFKRPRENLIDCGSDIQRFKMQRRESAAAAEEVARRVAEWHEAVLPRILEAKNRKKFNVHEYSDKLLARFPDGESAYRPFAEIVRGQPKHEICRYFLSSLMLTNNYNLQIRKSDDNPLATNCLELKLLTKERHYQETNE